MKAFFSIPLLAVLALMFNQGALAEPSRVFFQETADIEAEGSLSVDIDYPFRGYGATAGLRAGAFGGVVLINSHADANGTRMGFSASSAGPASRDQPRSQPSSPPTT